MVWCYTLPVECWCRVHKSQNLISDLLERCAAFEETCFKKKAEVTCPLKTVCFYTEQKLTDSDFSKYFGEKAMSRPEDINLQIEDGDSVNGFTLGAEFAGFFYKNDEFGIIKSVSDEAVILYSPRTKLKHYDVRSVLEKVVFSPLKVKSQYLKNLLEELKIQESKIQDDEQKRKIKVNQTEIDEFIGEIIALFNMSNIKEDLHPVIPGYEVLADIDDEVAKGILQFDSIRGFGYRFNTLHVDIEEMRPQDEVIQQNRERAITDYLKTTGITNIKFDYVSPTETLFTHNGAQCRANEVYGTLGCFAWMECKQIDSIQSIEQCALFTKHFAAESDKDNGIIYVNDKKLGGVFTNTKSDGGYDIAAATVYGPAFSSTSFRDSEGNFHIGNLHNDICFENYRELQDKPVYMWSHAHDKLPGRGKIIVPKYISKSCPLPHIKVRDLDASRRMAEKGDSGAIICMDNLDGDGVLLISMLRGSHESDEDVRSNPGRKRTYMSFSLKKGLDQLSEATGCKFYLA